MLNEGDIINIIPGHKVYAEIPEHFAFANRKGVFDKTAITDVVVGVDHNGLDTDYLVGRYIVVNTSMTGGGTGHGKGDSYPDGHHVFAENIETGGKINFYQSGCFTAMIEDIEPVGQAERTWKEV